MKHLIFIILDLSIAMFVNAQHYYATNGVGELELINDSNYIISLYSWNEQHYDDTGYYKIEKGIMYLSSKTLTWADVVEDFDTIKHPLSNDGRYIIKCYYGPERKFERMYEYVASQVFHGDGYDVLYCPFSVWKGQILTVYNNNTHMYMRFSPNKKVFKNEYVLHGFFIIAKSENIGRVYLDNFPLLIRKNKLIPIDSKKQLECWIQNGLTFPKLDIKKRRMIKKCIIYRGILGIEEGKDFKFKEL